MKENESGEFSMKIRNDASSLLTLISKFDFVVALVITRHVLDSTLPVTKLLQETPLILWMVSISLIA